MTRNGKNPLRRWLAFERAGGAGQAELALRDFFRLLNDPAPSSGFVDRVMVRILPLAYRERIGVVARALLAACLLLVALSVAWLPFLMWPLADVIRVGSLVDFLAATLVAASRTLAGWLSFWQSLADANRVLMTVISKPPIALLMLAVALFAAVGVRLLDSLKAMDRSPRNA